MNTKKRLFLSLCIAAAAALVHVHAAYELTLDYSLSGKGSLGLWDSETGQTIPLSFRQLNEYTVGKNKVNGPVQRIDDATERSAAAGVYEQTMHIEKKGGSYIIRRKIIAQKDMRYNVTDFFLDPAIIAGAEFSLDGEEKKHIVPGSPLPVNDRFKTVNGEARQWNTISFASKVGTIVMTFKNKRQLVDFQLVPWSTPPAFIIYGSFSLKSGETWEDEIVVSAEPDAKKLRTLSTSWGYFNPYLRHLAIIMVMQPAKNIIGGDHALLLRRISLRDTLLKSLMRPFGIIISDILDHYPFQLRFVNNDVPV